MGESKQRISEFEKLEGKKFRLDDEVHGMIMDW